MHYAPPVFVLKTEITVKQHYQGKFRVSDYPKPLFVSKQTPLLLLFIVIFFWGSPSMRQQIVVVTRRLFTTANRFVLPTDTGVRLVLKRLCLAQSNRWRAIKLRHRSLWRTRINLLLFRDRLQKFSVTRFFQAIKKSQLTWKLLPSLCENNEKKINFHKCFNLDLNLQRNVTFYSSRTIEKRLTTNIDKRNCFSMQCPLKILKKLLLRNPILLWQRHF